MHPLYNNVTPGVSLMQHYVYQHLDGDGVPRSKENMNATQTACIFDINALTV